MLWAVCLFVTVGDMWYTAEPVDQINHSCRAHKVTLSFMGMLISLTYLLTYLWPRKNEDGAKIIVAKKIAMMQQCLTE